MSLIEEIGKAEPKDTGVILPYEKYADFVHKMFKQMKCEEASKNHAILGMISELGELSDPIKKAWVYKSILDLENVLEELGDLAFYCFAYLNIEGDGDTYSRSINTKMPDAVNGVPLQVAIIGSMFLDLSDMIENQHRVSSVCNILNLVFSLGEIYGLTEHGILNANVHKLQEIYPSGVFQEHDAIARDDKLKDGEDSYL